MISHDASMDLTRHAVAPEPHIVIDPTICATCESQECVHICPAGCFTQDEGRVQFAYEGCLECGTCRVMCPRGGIRSWEYPAGGFGVSYRIG